MLRSSHRALFGLLLTGLLLAGCGVSTGLAIGEERVNPNEAQIEAEMITLIREISLQRREAREDELVRRFNQPKTIACLKGEMAVEALEPKLAVGMFANPGTYPVTLRFANATEFDDREKDLRGLSIRVSGVVDATRDDGTVAVNRGAQDFLLNSYPALFAGTPEDFLSFVQATESDNVLWYFLNPFDSHLKSLGIVLKARDNPTSPFATRYFSTTPIAYGDGAAVKYSVRSCSPPGAATAPDHKHYLRSALANDLDGGSQCLDFMVQFQSDPDLMPIEDASVAWPEEVSPFRTVAQITIESHEFSSTEALARCEAMQFNPWNGSPELRPLGGINRIRKNLYLDLGSFRTEQNMSATQGAPG